jgi:hypothetical protein
MASQFRLSRINLALLLLNIFMLGGCVVLLLLRGPSGPLVLLMIGLSAMAAGKIGRGFLKSKPAESNNAA